MVLTFLWVRIAIRVPGGKQTARNPAKAGPNQILRGPPHTSCSYVPVLGTYEYVLLYVDLMIDIIVDPVVCRSMVDIVVDLIVDLIVDVVVLPAQDHTKSREADRISTKKAKALIYTTLGTGRQADRPRPGI